MAAAIPAVIRPECPADHDAIAQLTARAFATVPYASGTEAAIIARLRSKGALHISLVALSDEELVGHIAFSPTDRAGWFAVGPVAVKPELQRRGIGTALAMSGLGRLKNEGAAGAILLGDPAYYGRFGFRAAPESAPANVPPEYFQALSFSGGWPDQRFQFDPAFFEP